MTKINKGNTDLFSNSLKVLLSSLLMFSGFVMPNSEIHASETTDNSIISSKAVGREIAWPNTGVNLVLDDNGTLFVPEGSYTFTPMGFSALLKSKEVSIPTNQVKKIVFEGPFKISGDASSWFADLAGLETIENLTYVDTSDVTSMHHMFYYAKNLKNLDLSNFNTKNVTDMHAMFSQMDTIEHLDLSSFDTSKVKNMWTMFDFSGSIKTINLSSFNTSNVENMESMFMGMSSLEKLDLSTFDTRNVTKSENMFAMDSRMSVLTLGETFEWHGKEALPNIQKISPYTGYWQNVGDGSIENPNGSNVWTSKEFMQNYDKLTDKDTYVWQTLKTEQTVFVKYEDTLGIEINTSKQLKLPIGSKYDVSTAEYKLNLSGYKYESVKGNVTGVIGENPITVTFVYTKNPITAQDLTVLYQDTEGKEVATAKIVSGYVGDTYDVSTAEYKLDLAGYTFKEVTGTVQGTLTEQAQTVVYVYTKNPVTSAGVNVSYIDTKGKKIADPKLITGIVGDTYDASTAEYKLDLEGYTFKEVQGSDKGKLKEDVILVTYVYTKNPVVAQDLTVLYQDTEGKEVAT
ncbi:MAG: MucBP domain-containing protein, partial [Erysipelothrix sp.]